MKKKRNEADSFDGSTPSSSGTDTMKKPPLDEVDYPSEKQPLTNSGDSFV